MKKIFAYFLLAGIIISFSCKKSSLDLRNPNAPTPEASLITEAGITNFALGIIQKQLGNILNAGTTNLMVMANTHHSLMGDELFMPYGNFGGRYSDQVYKITLPNGTVVTTPIGVTQKTTLQGFNNRPAGDVNAFQYEWDFCYFYIAQANTLLQALENPALTFSGDAATKKDLLKAWALWWKGYAYSRLGSMYLSALIYDQTSFNPTGKFVSHDAIITEANRVLDLCTATLTGITAGSTYNTLFQALTPSYNNKPDIITPDMWKRQINTMKARNLLANKKTASMVASDWDAIKTLTAVGLQSGDKIFKQGMTSDGNNDVTGAFFHPYILVGSLQEFTFVSERLMQEFKPGDARMDKNFYSTYDPVTGNAEYSPNIRSRGLQFGTRWSVTNVEDGGTYATNNLDSKALLPVAGTYEENILMTAEALIRTGNTEQGLQLVDQVRVFQNASLPAVAGTGLSQTEALEELRRERRISLFLRGVAFYDARRLGITAPAAQAGGRTGAMVYLPANIIPGLPKNDVRPCFMEYNYLDYFDVPQNEIDFNTPATGAAPVKN
jgi:starch-binding outer membrane protein, SusD/RagB family